MSEATIIAQSVLQKAQIDEHTIADSNTENDFSELENLVADKFFGRGVSTKQINFFMLSSVGWNYLGSKSKGNIQKPRLSDNIGWLWYYDFLTGAIPSNKTTVQKTAANSTNISPYAQRNKIVMQHDSIHNRNKAILCAQYAEIWDKAEVLSDVLTFAQPQLLEVGDTVTIDGNDYAVIDETTEGKVYQIDTVLTDGAKQVSYIVDFSEQLNRYPKLKKNINYTIGY